MNHLRVLVAEDSADDFETVRSYLESMKTDGFQFDIVRTSDGREALSMIRITNSTSCLRLSRRVDASSGRMR